MLKPSIEASNYKFYHHIEFNIGAQINLVLKSNNATFFRNISNSSVGVGVTII